MSAAAGGWPRARDLRLVAAALLAWLVAATTVALPPPWPTAAVVLAVLATAVAVCAAWLRRSTALAAVAVALAAGALVAVAAAAQLAARTPPVLLDASGGRAVVLDLRIDGPPDDGRMRTLAVAARPPGERALALAVPVLLFGAPDAAPPIGATVRVRAALVVAEPGDDVAFLAFPRDPPERIAEPPPLLTWTDDLRSGFRAVAAALPDPGGALLPGLAVGDTGAVGADLESAMRAASLTHLTAVSGANCAVVIALALVLGGVLGLPRIVRIAAALALLGGFVLLVTPQPSVQRAAVMAALVLVAAAVGRRSAGLPLLAGAVIGLLAHDPWLARDAGFALSVLATAALLTLTGAIADAAARVLPRGLALVLAVPVAAQLACQPVLVLLDPTLPLYGVPANLLAAPAAPVATVVGLLACVASGASPPFAAALAWVAWLPSSWIAGVAERIALLPGARLPWSPGPLGGLALAAASAVALLAVLPAVPRRVRLASAAGVLVLAVGYLGALGGARIAELVDRPADWTLALCDVGQGDAIVVRSGEATALVDTGPDPASLRDCLDDLGVVRIDLLVLTHYDLDHVGGVDAVLGRVDRTLVGPKAGEADERILRALAADGATVEPARRGDRGRLGMLDWVLRWPPDRGVQPGNAASIAMELRPADGCASGCLSALLLGDLDAESQRRMAAAAPIAPVDVVKVAHHGSADQDPAVYAAARASVALIGVGADNDYGHPTASALAMLSGSHVFRSDRDGLVLVAATADGGVAVWAEHLAVGAPP